MTDLHGGPKPTDPDTATFLEKCETQAVPTFEEIVRLYQHDVRLYVIRHLGADPAADDVAQEVFIEVYRGLATFEGRGSLKAWIMAIARHRVGSWFRKQSRQNRIRPLDIESDLVQYQLAQWEAEAERENSRGTDDLTWLRSCLKKLKNDHQRLVRRFYFEGVTAEVIARELGHNPGTVRMTLLRIRKALAKCIRKKRQARSTNHE